MPQVQNTVGRNTKGAPVAKETAESVITIAVANDHAIFRDGLRRLLSLEPDFDVVAEAKDGSEVMGILDDDKPDILLLDLRMPGVDGLSLLQRIQTQKIPTKIIVLTASDDEGEYVQAMKYGTSGIVLNQTATDATYQEHPQGSRGRDLAGLEDDGGGDAAVCLPVGRRAARA